MKFHAFLGVGLCMLLGACDLLNPARPSIQPDTEVFGHLIAVEQIPDQPGSWKLRLQVGNPRMVQKKAEEEGKPKPGNEGGVVAELLIDRNTVVLKDGMPAVLDDFDPGSEIVGVPVIGTTRMAGEKTILMSADLLCDFETYREWRLPLLENLGDSPVSREDPAAINSDGVEHAPVPLHGGRILYFSARLRHAPNKEGWIGARREGLDPAKGSESAPERSYRSQWSEEGWSAPELQVFPALESAQQLRISWVDPEEKVCLVSVVPGGESPPWIGRSERGVQGWGEVKKIEDSEGGDAFGAVYLSGSTSKIVFSSTRQSNSGLDLFLIDFVNQKQAMPLEPRINSARSEWGARIGPKNELYFCRDDRQLAFWSNMVHKVALDFPFRVPISELAPTDDGHWAFLTYSRLRPSEPDLEIWVAPIDSERKLGMAVPVESWKPLDPMKSRRGLRAGKGLEKMAADVKLLQIKQRRRSQ